jgi:hypothetical protein
MFTVCSQIFNVKCRHMTGMRSPVSAKFQCPLIRSRYRTADTRRSRRSKNGFSRNAADNCCQGGGVPSYNTITSSTFKVHQHPLTYNGLGTLPITTTVKDVGRDRYATIAAGGGGGGATVGAGGGANGDGAVLAYQTTGYSKRFPAHSAALGFQSRVVDGGYFTDDRQLSDGDSNSPVGSP